MWQGALRDIGPVRLQELNSSVSLWAQPPSTVSPAHSATEGSGKLSVLAWVCL